MSNIRFGGPVADRARGLFSNVRILADESDEQIVTTLQPPIHPKTFSRLLITEQTISAEQLRATARFAASQIGTSADRILGYVRRPDDPAYALLRPLATAEIYRPTSKDLRRLRARLNCVEQSTRLIRIWHRLLPSRLLIASLVRTLLPPALPGWTQRLLTTWSNQQRKRLPILSQRIEIECSLLDVTLEQLERGVGPFALCKPAGRKEQIEHLHYHCLEELGIRILLARQSHAAVRRVLTGPWAHWQSVVLFDQRVALRRDCAGNRFLFDSQTCPDAGPIVQQDITCYERLAQHAVDPDSWEKLETLCGRLCGPPG